MPELGKYAVEVLSAYGVSLILLVVLVAGSWRSSKRAQATLAEAEAEVARDG